jgi:hypothetical protein
LFQFYHFKFWRCKHRYIVANKPTSQSGVECENRRGNLAWNAPKTSRIRIAEKQFSRHVVGTRKKYFLFPTIEWSVWWSLKMIQLAALRLAWRMLDQAEGKNKTIFPNASPDPASLGAFPGLELLWSLTKYPTQSQANDYLALC